MKKENNVVTNEKSEEITQVNEKTKNGEITKPKKKGNKVFLIVGIVLVVAVIAGATIVGSMFGKKVADNDDSKDKEEIVIDSKYKMSSNSLSDFDLFFLREENELKNKIYSPLSIKYALEMLNEGTDGETKAQISGVIGEYTGNKYTNSKNLSLANGLFINEKMKDSIKSDYVSNLQDKYNALVFYDPFTSPDNVNKWVSDNTFNLVHDLLNDVMDKDFILINALAIDMEWVNKIQSDEEMFSSSYDHETYDATVFVDALASSGYSELKFSNVNYDVKAVQIGAAANRYDIVNDLKEENIRNKVTDEYNKFVKADECGYGNDYEPVKSVVDNYIKEINSNYGYVGSSTDFSFYVDDSVKVFAKDLKEYDGTTLQYVGIMPTTESLDSYINNISSTKVEELIDSLKDAKNIESYTDGKVTRLTGTIPVFNFDYELNLLEDLKKMGITDVFDSSKADLSKLTSNKGTYIDTAVHKANIDFSNVGIKAAAATAIGGYGAADCSFDYLYDVPIEEIDLTFNKPFMFLIRDKKSGEIWFTGTVYEPTKITDVDRYGTEF